jgi:hypothetical protein
MENLKEAAGNIDRLYTLLDSAVAAVNKAAAAIEAAGNAVLDVTDILDDAQVECTAIGGKVNEIIPSHFTNIIAELTRIAETELVSTKHKIEAYVDNNGQSSLNQLKELVNNMPYKDTHPETKEEKRARILAGPDLTQGPQSSILGSQEQPAEPQSAIAPDPVQESTDRAVIKSLEENYVNNKLNFGKLKAMYGQNERINEAANPFGEFGMLSQLDANGVSLAANNVPSMNFDRGQTIRESGSMSNIQESLTSGMPDMGMLDFSTCEDSGMTLGRGGGSARFTGNILAGVDLGD